MKNKVCYITRICLLLVVISCSSVMLHAQSKVKIQGKWECNVSSSDITEAGNDFAGEYENNLGDILLSVNDKKSNETAGYSWTVSVHKTDSFWDDTASIYIKRASDGDPYDSDNTPTTLTGGTSYQLVTNTEQFFFSGYRGSVDIDIQIKIQEVSVSMIAQTYSTYIVYTVASI